MSETVGNTGSTSREMRVLLVEDNPDDRYLVTRLLERGELGAYDVIEAGTWFEARQKLIAHRHDVVLLDLSLPDSEGEELVQSVKQTAPAVPIVIMTGRDDHDWALRTLQLGAQDYLIKGRNYEGTLERILRHAMERQRVLEELDEMRASQMRLKDELLSHVSHELRTPLTAIHQFVSILQDGLAGELSEQQREYLGITMRNVDQLREMIGDLMEGTRAQEGKLRVEPQPLDLRGPIAEAVRVLAPKAAEKSISLDGDTDPEVRLAHADGNRVRQILTNLVENAIKFTPDGGSISVSLREDPDEPGFARVSVADTGCGIPESQVEKVFGRLQQEQEHLNESRKGLGLGLYIVKELVEKHGGRIWVESKLHQGSTFHLTLPLFDLARLLRTALLEGGSLRKSYSIIRVEIGVLDPTTSIRIPDSIRNDVYELLRGSTFSGIDALLPRFPQVGLGEDFLLITGTDQSGMDAVVQRLRRRLKEREDLPQWNVKILVEGETHPIPPEGDPAAAEERILAIAAELDRRIRGYQGIPSNL